MAAQLCEYTKPIELYILNGRLWGCELCLNKAVIYKRNTFKEVSSPWFPRWLKHRKMKKKKTSFSWCASEYSTNELQRAQNNRGILMLFHFCLLDIYWVKWKTLRGSSMGSLFLLVMTVGEWAKVTGCLVNEWMNNKGMSEQAPCSFLGFSYRLTSLSLNEGFA